MKNLFVDIIPVLPTFALIIIALIIISYYDYEEEPIQDNIIQEYVIIDHTPACLMNITDIINEIEKEMPINEINIFLPTQQWLGKNDYCIGNMLTEISWIGHDQNPHNIVFFTDMETGHIDYILENILSK